MAFPILGFLLFMLVLFPIALFLGLCIWCCCCLCNRTNNSNDNRDHVQRTVLPVYQHQVLLVREPAPGDIELRGNRNGLVKGTTSVGTNEASTSTSKPESSSALSVKRDKTGGFGWGKWYGLKELENATNFFSDAFIIGKGGFGVVYRGVMEDGLVVAIKSLFNNKGQAEREFRVEVEAIGKVRHRNLVHLLGYCAEGAQRFLVYEYIDNGTLEQWLHYNIGPLSPLTWEIRMEIAMGIAQGLAYLHEALDPKVIHRDVKSSNILLDKKWNPKLSDFGLAKLLGSDKNYIMTRVMGTFGYVCPAYASTGMLTEANDVYSFGILLMELVTGKNPVDYSRALGQMKLIDWFREMVSASRSRDVIDPLIEVPPPIRTLKRIILLCLRCTERDAKRRPKMGQVIKMLVGEDFSSRNTQEPRSVADTAPLHPQADLQTQEPRSVADTAPLHPQADLQTQEPRSVADNAPRSVADTAPVHPQANDKQVN